MPITTVRIASLGEFVDRVTPDAPDPVTGRRRDVGVYRGSSDADAPLFTTLDRLGGGCPPHTKSDLEVDDMRNFISYARHNVCAETVKVWEHSYSAKIHGEPTSMM